MAFVKLFNFLFNFLIPCSLLQGSSLGENCKKDKIVEDVRSYGTTFIILTSLSIMPFVTKPMAP